jgi:membrane-associated phospholipid phosphatase
LAFVGENIVRIQLLKAVTAGIMVASFVVGSLPLLAATPFPVARDSTFDVEPKAGAWKTWLLTSGDQFRLPAPPDAAATETEIQQLKEMAAKRDAAALDEIAYWDTGAPAYRWNEIAVQQLLTVGAPGNIAFRDLALLNVAIYDSTVAAWDTKYAFNRPRPSEADASLTTVIAVPDSPAYPSEHAVTAGAASAVLAYLFPNDAQKFLNAAESAANSRLMAGVDYPSDVKAGMELGQKVAALVIEHGKADGSDAKWTGTVPTEAGKWTGTEPIFPMGGTWKAWMLTAPDMFRPAAPPAYDSEQMKTEMAEVRDFKRTPISNSAAFYWEYAAGGRRNFLFWTDLLSRKTLEYRMDSNPPLAARAYAIFNTAYYDSGVACWDAKYAYWGIRPFQLDPEFKPLIGTPNHPSYPSAHSCLSSTAADVLTYLFPRDGEAFHTLLKEISESRIWAGIHFRSDLVAGIDLGKKVAEVAIERAKADGAQ